MGVQAALSMTSAKELRALAEKEQLLTKWDALPESVKLEKARARAEESVRLQNLRAEKDRAQRKKKKEEHDDEVMKKGGPMAELMADKPGWEIEEWDPGVPLAQRCVGPAYERLMIRSLAIRPPPLPRPHRHMLDVPMCLLGSAQ